MAAGNMAYINISTGYNSTDGYYIKGMLEFNYNPKYYLTKNSLRVYYRPITQQGDADYVDIVPPDSTETGSHILKADTWQKPYDSIPKGNRSIANLISKTVFDLDCSDYIVTFTIGNLTANTTYRTTAWLRLFNSKGSLKKTMRDPIDEGGAYEAKTDYVAPVPSESYEKERPLFQVATYAAVDNDTYNIAYEDFTNCIKLGSYDVNSEDVNEDWDDADYRTHRIVTRRKITGKFEMIFPTMTRQKEFFYLLDRSKELNGEGNAYVDLRVMVNNVLDVSKKDATLSDVADMQCINYQGKFFIKIDNNAWVQPIYGHYDKYSPLSVTIQEA